MNRDGNRPDSADIDLAASDWVVRRNFGLTADEQVELARWASENPLHAEALARHAQAWALLDRPRSVGKGDFMVRELRARATRQRRRRMGIATATAAVALMVVFWRTDLASTASEGAAVTRTVMLVPEKRILPDGSVVELKAAAQITVEFSDAFRRVVLRRGEAHFEVAKNPLRPFIVTAAGLNVRAVGTAFAVQLGTSEIEVLVTEGRVAVDRRESAPAAPAGSTEVEVPVRPLLEELTSGQRAVIGFDDTVARIESVPPAQIAQRLAWRAPRLEFSNTPLAEAVGQMNRHSSMRIEIADPALARMRVNGLFRADNTDTFVRLVELSFDATAERSDDSIVLKLRAASRR